MRTRQEDWNLKKFQGTADMLKIEEAAVETSSWIQDAVGDVAYNCDYSIDEKVKRKIAKAVKDGVQDIHGWLADEYYNEEDTLSDLLGNHIFDHASRIVGTTKDPAHGTCFIKICEAMLPQAHSAMANVLNRFIKEHKARL